MLNFNFVGNYGEKGFWTVASPGLAKNSLSVASNENLQISFASFGFEVTHNNVFLLFSECF